MIQFRQLSFRLPALLNHILALILMVIGLASCSKTTEQKGVEATDQSRPNIIYILADDLGYGDPRCYNANSGIPTPHIDELASEGMRFTDMHSGSAVCTPTRYGILTGRYSWRTRLKSGVLDGLDPHLIEASEVTVAEVLKEAGYHTACIGKWHLGVDFVKTDPNKPLYQGSFWEGITDMNVDYSQGITNGPTDHGFDFSLILPSSLDIQPYCLIENKKILGLPMDTTLGNKLGGTKGAFWRPGDMSTNFDINKILNRFTAQSISYLRERKKAEKQQPFFLYLPLSAPHTPWLPGEPYVNTSAAGEYGDFVAHVDAVVGRLMEELDALQLADNTLVIFTSDNGAHWNAEEIAKFRHQANANFRGQKADIWEGGHSVPFIARWPNQIAAGVTNNSVACLTDFTATVADLIGQKLPKSVAPDSYSLKPIMLNSPGQPFLREPVIHHSASGKFAIRKGQWKLIPSRGSGGFTEPKEYEPSVDEPAGQLYDLIADISEQNNLYAEYPEVVAELTAELERIKNE